MMPKKVVNITDMSYKITHVQLFSKTTQHKNTHWHNIGT